MEETDDLVSVGMAAKQVGVGRNTMLLAAKRGKIKAKKIGSHWYVFGSDLERWKRDDYRPDMAFRFPAKNDADEE